jgi:hypothetical protein
LKSQRGPKETFLRKISKFSPKNFLWSPFEIFSEKNFPGGIHPTYTPALLNPVYKDEEKFCDNSLSCNITFDNMIAVLDVTHQSSKIN